MGAAEKYLLDELTEEQRSQYEEHVFDCRECAEDVTSGAVFVANAKKVLSEPKAERVKVPGDERPRPGWRALFWPVPAGAAAGIALLFGGPAAYLALHELPRLRGELAQAEAIQAAPQYFITVSRSELPVVTASKTTRMVALTLSRGSEWSHPYYWCELVGPAGNVLFSADLKAPARGSELELLLPVTGLEPGSHSLALHGLDRPSGSVAARDFARYSFKLEREQE